MMTKHFLQRELRILEKEKEINELQSVSKVICLFFVLKDCIYPVFSRSAGDRRFRRLLVPEMPATLLDQITSNFQLVFSSVLNLFRLSHNHFERMIRQFVYM